jgi:hypothetical protein
MASAVQSSATEQPQETIMRHLRSNWARLALMLGALMLGGCGGIVAEDCSVKCSHVKNDCTQKCTDDACKTRCTTDFDNCKLSCDKVKTGGNTAAESDSASGG